jgi:hypothetical protein
MVRERRGVVCVALSHLRFAILDALTHEPEKAASDREAAKKYALTG